jgi:hypothetical protein
MDGVAKGRQLTQEGIRPFPVPDRCRHIWAVLEIAEQPDHAGDIAGNTPSSQEAVSGGIQIGRRLLHRVSRGPIAERNGDRLLEPVKEGFVAGLRIDREEVDGVLLALRPQALCADIGANR